MFRSAFLSEYSLQSDTPTSRVLKSHLLSNAEIIIPAAAMQYAPVSDILGENLQTFSAGALKIAHGNDCPDLLGYMAKYPDVEWDAMTTETFQAFQATSHVSVYDIRDTFKRFNAIMRQCAEGKSAVSADLFSHAGLNTDILARGDINLFAYFDLVETHISDPAHKAKLLAYLRYIYNLCGALSTDSGNTFSIENAQQFNYIKAESHGVPGIDSGLSLLISCALDVTDGLEDFVFLDDFSISDLDRLSFEDILTMRENWLHGAVVQSYESVVSECVAAMGCAEKGDTQGAFIHIDRAFELRSMVTAQIRSRLSSEITAYKMHRLGRFLTDSSVQLAGFLTGVSLVKSIAQAIYGATTEVAVLTNRETALKKMINDKTEKIQQAKHAAELRLRAKSPTVEYLRLISDRLSN